MGIPKYKLRESIAGLHRDRIVATCKAALENAHHDSWCDTLNNISEKCNCNAGGNLEGYEKILDWLTKIHG